VGNVIWVPWHEWPLLFIIGLSLPLNKVHKCCLQFRSEPSFKLCLKPSLKRKLIYMASALPDLRSPSQPYSITAPWPVPSCAWWQRHTGVNSLPKATARWWRGRTQSCDLSIASPMPYRQHWQWRHKNFERTWPTHHHLPDTCVNSHLGVVWKMVSGWTSHDNQNCVYAFTLENITNSLYTPATPFMVINISKQKAHYSDTALQLCAFNSLHHTHRSHTHQ